MFVRFGPPDPVLIPHRVAQLEIPSRQFTRGLLAFDL